jgi:cell wall-associated NlpC family hydrolase
MTLKDIPRGAVVLEALSWVGTPYMLGAALKGVGVDCAQFVASVYKAVGFMPMDEAVGIFSHDWFIHTKEDKYLLRLLKYTKKIAETKVYRTTNVEPGNVILSKAAHSYVYNHAGIITKWPMIVHAVLPIVEEVNATQNQMWSYQHIVILDPWKKETE